MKVRLNPNVRITGTGTGMPDRIVDNVALGHMVTGYDESVSGPFSHWVDRVSHIHERRFCDRTTRTSDLALVAARQALDTAGVDPSDLGLITYASTTMSQIFPGDQCRLANELGATSAGTFNLQAACAGTIYGLGIAYGMIAAGVYDHVLVVGAEIISAVTNFSDPVTAILFGDGAGAAVVSRHDGEEGKGMLPPDLALAYSPWHIHQGNSNVPTDVAVFPEMETKPGVPLVEQALVEMDSGPNVLRQAVMHMAVRTVRCLGYDRRDLRRGDEDLRRTLDRAWIVPHQANGRIIDGLVDRLKVPPERVIRTIYEYANISAASNLIALDHGIRYGNTARRLDDEGNVLEIVKQPEHRIREGDLVLMPSIGGGYLMGCIGFVL